MPFHSGEGVVYGDEARDVTAWACKVLSAWLSAQLESTYAGSLGVGAQRKPVVTDNSRIATAAYSKAERPPVVFMQVGEVDSRVYRTNIAGDKYRGARYEITLELDMGISDKSGGDATAVIKEDSALAAAVYDAIQRGRDQLDQRGLYNSEITADTEKQRAGVGRHPHRLTFFCLAIETYPQSWD